MIKRRIRATLLDISRKANVSVNTAAKVLAGQVKEARISEKTASKVLKISKEIGYVPNLMARNLRSKRTKIIGAFIADITDSAYVSITQSILKNLHDKGFSPFLTVAEIGPEICMREWLQMKIEGLIFSGTTEWVTRDFIEELKNLGIVSIIAGCTFRNPDYLNLKEVQISTVSVDNYAGIQLAVGHLLEINKKKIAHLCGPSWHGDAWERRVAYESIVSKYHPPIVICPDSTKHFWQMGYNGMAQLHRNRTEYDAIIAYDDQFAIGSIKWLIEHGITVPAQVAVVGFDNSPESQSCTPALTTITQPVEQIAHKSVNLVQSYLDTQPSIEKIQIAPSLIIRESA